MGHNLTTDTLLSFSSGLLTFVASCFFPIILIYFSFIIGQSLYKANQTYLHKNSFLIPMMLVVFGLVFIFVLNNFPSNLQHFFMYQYDIFSKIAGIIVILFGLTYLGVDDLIPFKEQKSSFLLNSPLIAIKFLFFGLALGVSWLHCLTPILGLTISMVYNTPALATRGFYLLVINSFGLAIPLMVSGFLLYKFIRASNRIKKYIKEVKTINALFLTTMGVLIFVKPWWVYVTKKIISTASFSLNNYLETKLLELLLK